MRVRTEPGVCEGWAGEWVTLAEASAPALGYRLWCGPCGSPEPISFLRRRFGQEHPSLEQLPPERALLHFVGWLLCHHGYEVAGGQA